VGTVNTPTGNIAKGATIPVTWTYTPGNAAAGVLRVVNNATGNSQTLNDNLNLATQSYSWLVNVDPAVYYFALNDGTGDKYSGQFTVVQGSGSAASGTAPPQPAQSQSRATSAPAAPHLQEVRHPRNAAKSTSAPSANTAASFTGSSFSGYKLLFSLIVVAAAM
ncbi:33027_t:CDS:2, partial [Racocetra persica]